jgi:hypothetical protein
MLFERTVVVNNLLYGKSEMQRAEYSVKAVRRHSVRDANNVTHFFERNKKTMKQNDYRRMRETQC